MTVAVMPGGVVRNPLQARGERMKYTGGNGLELRERELRIQPRRERTGLCMLLWQNDAAPQSERVVMVG